MTPDSSEYNPLGKTEIFRFSSKEEERLFNPNEWNDEVFHKITDKQAYYIQQLAQATKTPLPQKEHLKMMNSKHARKCIVHLKNKKEEIDKATPPTKGQIYYINKHIDCTFRQEQGFLDVRELTKHRACR